MHCCSCDFGASAERQFDTQRAAQDLNRYKKKGPLATTRLMIQGLAQQLHAGTSLLDIGGGVGALAFELLDKGIRNAVLVDASSAYIEAVSQEIVRRGRSGALHVVHGDFLDVAPQVPFASIVALDRVICCYPNCERMLGEALRHAESCFAMSYPRDEWYVRTGVALENGVRRFRGNPFRAFVHPAEQMQSFIDQAGFRLANRKRTWMWCVDVYLKQAEEKRPD